MRRSLVALLACVLMSACAGSSTTRSGDDLLFSRDVLPVIQSSFVPLLTEDSGLDAGSWQGLMAGSDQGEVVIPFDAERSLLIELAERRGGPTADEIALVRRWIDAGAPNDAGAIPFADADQLLYVCNQGAAVISVIDMESNLVIRTVDLRDLGFSENAKPHHVVVSPDGATWYVSLIGENTVLKFNRDNEVVASVSFEVPGLLSLDGSGERLYAGRSMSAVNPPQRIGFVERDRMDVEEVDVFFPRPHALKVSADGGTVYSASLAVNQMASIDVNTLDIEITDIPGPHHSLVQFAVSPDGGTMIAGGEMSGELLFFDLSEPMNPAVVKSLSLGGAPWHPTFAPDGSRAYVPRKQADAVSVIDMSTRSESAAVSGRGLSQPHGSAVRPDGAYLYISNNNLDGAYTTRYPSEGGPAGTVTVIDTATLRVVKVLEVENYPTGLGTRSAP